MFPQTYSQSNSISLHFNELWMAGQVPTKSIRVVNLQELALMYTLEDFLVNVDLPLKLDRDVDLFLATKTRQDVFYLAATMVIRQHGISSKDRFFNEFGLVSSRELKQLSISGGSKTSRLDSLYDLLIFAYRKCNVLFKDLKEIKSNKELFYCLCSILNAVYSLILSQKKKNFTGYLHVKALLTTIMAIKNPYILTPYM